MTRGTNIHPFTHPLRSKLQSILLYIIGWFQHNLSPSPNNLTHKTLHARHTPSSLFSTPLIAESHRERASNMWHPICSATITAAQITTRHSNSVAASVRVASLHCKSNLSHTHQTTATQFFFLRPDMKCWHLSYLRMLKRAWPDYLSAN